VDTTNPGKREILFPSLTNLSLDVLCCVQLNTLDVLRVGLVLLDDLNWWCQVFGDLSLHHVQDATNCSYDGY
jgi:hypothetical protein